MHTHVALQTRSFDNGGTKFSRRVAKGYTENIERMRRAQELKREKQQIRDSLGKVKLSKGSRDKSGRTKIKTFSFATVSRSKKREQFDRLMVERREHELQSQHALENRQHMAAKAKAQEVCH